MTMHQVFDATANAFEVAGVAAMVVGTLVAFWVAGQRLFRREDGSFQVLRTALGGAIMLGLEILVAADLIRTITSTPSLENVGALAVIVLLRTVLSMSIAIEVEGVLPWKRAALQSGGQILARTVATERGRKRQDGSIAPVESSATD